MLKEQAKAKERQVDGPETLNLLTLSDGLETLNLLTLSLAPTLTADQPQH